MWKHPIVRFIGCATLAGMNQAHSEFICVEARSLTTLRLKVIARSAAGWVLDGPQVEVTDYYGKRSVTRHSQAMYRAVPVKLRWEMLR
jgi:hypothetical protein